MGQVTTGIRAVLSSPRIYDVAQNLLGAERNRARIVKEYLRPRSGQRLLDIGCGTARIVPHLPPDVSYVGVDLSEEYIAAAKEKFGGRGDFQCIDISRAAPGTLRHFDLSLAIGLLHHLDDAQALVMLRTAHEALVRGGRLITLDPCFAEGQHPFARMLIVRDRGRNVRPAAAYATLARKVFSEVQTHVRNDMLRIPYTHAILECCK